MTVRNYSSVAAETTLTGGITPAGTSIQVGSTSGFPVSTPYTLALDYESASEELVDVTAAAGTTLTVTRAVDGTSATSHSAGARVRHVSSARDFRDSRDHENASTDVHGLTGGAAVVGTTTTQTLSNKTLTTPTINGAALSGTFSGTPTFSGAVTMSGGGTLNGTFAGSPTFSGGVTFSGVANLNAGGALVGTFSGNSTLSGTVTHSGLIQSNRAASTDVALATISTATGDTFDRYRVFIDGKMEWGAGNIARDTNLYRNNVNELKTDDALVVAGNLSAESTLGVTGNATIGGNLTVTGVGQVQAVRKSANESRTSTTTATLDAELFGNVVSGATYIFDCSAVVQSNTAGADFVATFGGTSAGTVVWSGDGPHNSMVGGSQADGEWIARIGVATTTPYAASQTAGVAVGVRMNGSFTCSSSGTFGLQWAQQASSATSTILNSGSYIRIERIA